MSDAELRLAFSALFGREPEVVLRAPGRVNLIGEHVDYNDGLVLPLAVDRYCWLAAAPRPDEVLRVHSLQFDETVELDSAARAGNRRHWSDYVAGVAWSLRRARTPIRGADLMVDSDIPVGAGLSSSAALEVATAQALLALSGQRLDGIDVALVCQRAENDYVGANVGIMDQLTACLGIAGQVLLIDCRSLAVEPILIDETEVAVMVANTMVKHDLAGSGYNERRKECAEALSLVKKTHPGASSLRDVRWWQIEAGATNWPHSLMQRARHVTSEIERVEKAAIALKQRAYPELGRLMNESHASLARDYEVSSPELDRMAQLARDLGAYGARMTGGGFGGCVVSLVMAREAISFARQLADAYEAELSVVPEVYTVKSADGAGRVR